MAVLFSHFRQLNVAAREAARAIARFKYIADHATDTILQLDVTGRIRYANLMAAQHFGRSVADLTGSDIPGLLPAAQWESLREALVATRKGETRTVELILGRSGGSPLVLEMVCNGVWIEGEFIVHAAARDVTERRQIERRLSEVRHWESLGVMAGGMAHDFNNLLTTILGNASLVKNNLPPGDESEDLLNSVIDASERSADLIRLMLSTAGYRSPYIEWLHPALVLDHVLSLRPLPENVRVSVTARPEVFPGDRRSLETLLWSLIANAAESYSGLAGEIRIALTSGPVEPRKTDPASGELHFDEGDAQGDCLGIVVEDSGCGMRPEVLERAFDPFYSSHFMGRGLGLPAVRGIVRAYSGTLRVSTLAGRGTRIEVWLPRSDKGAKAAVSARTKG
jgi:PAS domain S-box-containing protein